MLDNRDQLLDAMVDELKTLKKASAHRVGHAWWRRNALIAERAASQRPNTELLRQRPWRLCPPMHILIQADGQVKVVSPQVLGRMHLSEACPW